MSPKTQAYGALIVGVLIAAWASILIRWAGEAPSLVIAASRMVLTALILTPICLARGVQRELRGLDRRSILLVILSGVALALHFATWISSLAMTTVASSVVLVSTHPLFVGFATHFVLKERVSRLAAAGIVVAVLGSVLVGYGDFGLSGEALLGDLLALLGGLTAAIYFLLGRRLRQQLSILAYIWPVYSVSAVILLAICLLSGYGFGGYAPVTYLMFLLLAVGPQLLGHSSMNFALGQLSAVFVTVVVLGEPIGSSVLALLLLGEVPPWPAFLGGALILGGIVLAGQGEGRASRVAS